MRVGKTMVGRKAMAGDMRNKLHVSLFHTPINYIIRRNDLGPPKPPKKW